MTHLHDQHNISKNTTPDLFISYINKYGNPGCVCGCGREVGIKHKGMVFNLFATECQNKGRYSNPACPEFHLFRGLSVDETIAAISNVQSKTITSTHRNKLSAANTGQLNPMSTVSLESRGVTDTDRYLQKKNGGKKNGFYGKKHKDETLIRLAKVRSKMSKVVTKPELAVWGMLHGLQILFRPQHPVDKYIVDFYVNGKIIEVYGDYWHSGNMVSQHTGRSIKHEDKLKLDRLIDLGYEVLVIWESEIFLSPHEIVIRLREFCEIKID